MVASLTADFTSVGSASIAVELTGVIDQGDDFSNRDGRKIVIDSLILSGTLVGGQSNAVTDDAYNAFRIMLYENGGTAAPVAVFTTSFLTPEISASMGTLLYDSKLLLATPGDDSTGYVPAVKLVDVNIPINRVYLYPTTNGLASPMGLYLVMVSDSAAVSHPGFVSGTYVIRFHDV